MDASPPQKSEPPSTPTAATPCSEHDPPAAQCCTAPTSTLVDPGRRICVWKTAPQGVDGGGEPSPPRPDDSGCRWQSLRQGASCG